MVDIAPRFVTPSEVSAVGPLILRPPLLTGPSRRLLTKTTPRVEAGAAPLTFSMIGP